MAPTFGVVIGEWGRGSGFFSTLGRLVGIKETTLFFCF
jgi:hypothetical protein